jgi:hypothetical protein
MPNWFSEFLYVLSSSYKTQWALILGVVLHIVITLLGEYMIANFELQGSMKALEEVIGNKLLRRYDKLALFVLVSFWLVAIRNYIKARKRLLQ